MSKLARIAPPNSLLVVSDIEGGDAPLFIAGEPILSTPSCITVGCLAFADGETEVRLAHASEFSDRGPPRWDQVLETPSRVLAVSTVAGDVILEEAVGEAQTRVRIWGNRFPEPDEVLIGLGQEWPLAGGVTRHRSTEEGAEALSSMPEAWPAPR